MPIICPEFLLLQLKIHIPSVEIFQNISLQKNFCLPDHSGRWERRGKKRASLNWLEYMALNFRLHFIRTLILTSPGKLKSGLIFLVRLQLQLDAKTSWFASMIWSCYNWPNLYPCIGSSAKFAKIIHSNLMVKSLVMILSCLALDLSTSLAGDHYNNSRVPDTPAGAWPSSSNKLMAIFWYHNS